MGYLKHYEPKNGFTRVSTIGDGDLKLTEFGIINLGAGEKYAGQSGACEVVLLVLGGRCAVNGPGFAFIGVGERADVFSGRPHAVYLPRGLEYEITAAGAVEVAWAASPSDLDTGPYLVSPAQVREVSIGRDNYRRDARLVLTDACPARHLFVGEALVPSGNHASYPPHRHDFDNLPAEVDMEEIYFFRFSPTGGYGIQKIYTDDRALDVTVTVVHNDLTLIPRGYHPVINAPGYTMYYLWVMAGEKNRKFVSVTDPAHARVLDRK